MISQQDILRARQADFQLILSQRKIEIVKDHLALCPFHNDTRPSMTLDLDRGLYHCFSCNAGGDRIKFVMDFDGISFTEAVSKLAGTVPIINLVKVQHGDTPKKLIEKTYLMILDLFFELKIKQTTWYEERARNNDHTSMDKEYDLDYQFTRVATEALHYELVEHMLHFYPEMVESQLKKNLANMFLYFKKNLVKISSWMD